MDDESNEETKFRHEMFYTLIDSVIGRTPRRFRSVRELNKLFGFQKFLFINSDDCLQNALHLVNNIIMTF